MKTRCDRMWTCAFFRLVSSAIILRNIFVCRGCQIPINVYFRIGTVSIVAQKQHISREKTWNCSYLLFTYRQSLISIYLSIFIFIQNWKKNVKICLLRLPEAAETNKVTVYCETYLLPTIYPLSKFNGNSMRYVQLYPKWNWGTEFYYNHNNA